MITAKEIMQLRERTGIGMMDCKKALEEAGGDMDKAIEVLKKKGLAKAAKRAERETKAGIVDAYIHANGQIGVLVELQAETDFVARNDEFKELAHDIALHAAAMNPKYLSKEEVPSEVVEKEKTALLEQAKAEGKPENIAEKIVAGRLDKFYAEICLLEQPFVKDQDKTISELINEKVAKIGEKIVLSRFSRFEIGE